MVMWAVEVYDFCTKLFKDSEGCRVIVNKLLVVRLTNDAFDDYLFIFAWVESCVF